LTWFGIAASEGLPARTIFPSRARVVGGARGLRFNARLIRSEHRGRCHGGRAAEAKVSEARGRLGVPASPPDEVDIWLVVARALAV
jgi:hypothetical protein